MKVLATLPPATRRNLLLLFLAGFCFWSSLTCLLPALPLYIESVGANQQQVGLVMGSFAIGLLLSRGLLGVWADRHSRRLVVQIGALAVGLAPLAYLSASSLPWLALVRSFHGISIAGFTTGYSALVVDLSPREQRGEIIGYMTLVVPIGMALGPAFGGYLATDQGYGALFIAAGVLGLLGFLLAGQIREPRAGASQAIAAPPTPVLAPRQLLRTLFSLRLQEFVRKPRLRIPALVLLLIGLVFGTLTTFLPAYIRDTGVGLNAGLFYTAVAAASFTVRVIAGRASDRWGRGLFITCSLLGYITSMALLAIAQNSLAFLLAAIAEGAGAGTLIPMMTALVADRSTIAERGQVYALCIGGFDLGIAIGGPLSGSFAGLVGYAGIFAIACGLATTALLLFLTCSSKDLAHSFRFATGRGGDVYALEAGS
ncbi:MAG: MFS transporter [Spirulinaceae cyanobacterium RM2_2_10]|nr:MFS transporter [Spirulinaceae cyanobacterium SM2_1_0]NJO19599.1 MFS transporter [Spirulinaceae cyanobacterium RM2_2_10]